MAQISTKPVIPNTSMKTYVNNDGIAKAYFIKPNEGYLLHDNRLDSPNADDTRIVYGYTTAEVSVGTNYDFEKNIFGLFTCLKEDAPYDKEVDENADGEYAEAGKILLGVSE